MRYDDAFANGKYIEGAEAYPPLWADKAAQFRDKLGTRARLSLPYGEGERHWFDLFLPEDEAKGLMIFIHGGYWRAFGPRDFSHLAAGAGGARLGLRHARLHIGPRRTDRRHHCRDRGEPARHDG